MLKQKFLRQMKNLKILKNQTTNFLRKNRFFLKNLTISQAFLEKPPLKKIFCKFFLYLKGVGKFFQKIKRSVMKTKEILCCILSRFQIFRKILTTLRTNLKKIFLNFYKLMRHLKILKLSVKNFSVIKMSARNAKIFLF